MKLSNSMRLGVAALCTFGFGAIAEAKEALPPHFTIHQTDLGAVFADNNGMTLYWVASAGTSSGVASCIAYARGDGPNQPATGDDLNLAFRGSATCADKYPIAVA